MEQAVIETNLVTLNLLKRGKVRDIYDLGDHLLMVATDRISAFDVVMPNPIPDKGKILTQISLFWFEIMKPVLPNHVISANVDNYPEICKPYSEILRGRSMLVKKAEPLPVETIVGQDRRRREIGRLAAHETAHGRTPSKRVRHLRTNRRCLSGGELATALSSIASRGAFDQSF